MWCKFQGTPNYVGKMASVVTVQCALGELCCKQKTQKLGKGHLQGSLHPFVSQENPSSYVYNSLKYTLGKRNVF